MLDLIKNLINHSGQNKFALTITVDALLKDFDDQPEKYDNPRQLSLLILLAGGYGHQLFYNKVLNKILEKINVVEGNEQAWLRGRILLAADSMQDEKTAHEMAVKMQEQLMNSQASKDVFAAWAWSYYAIYSAATVQDNYQKTQLAMFDIGATVTDNVADILWTKVMNLLAVATADSQDIANCAEKYSLLCNEIIKINNSSSVVDALMQIPTNDFREWAISLVLLATATINEEHLYNALKTSLTTIISDATGMNKALAHLNMTLAEARWELRPKQEVQINRSVFNF